MVISWSYTYLYEEVVNGGNVAPLPPPPMRLSELLHQTRMPFRYAAVEIHAGG